MENYESLTNALSDLKHQGYEADFTTEPFCLYCGDLDMRLNPDAFHVDHIYQIDEHDNQHEHPTVYAISSDTGIKGTVVEEEGEEAL